MENNHFAEGNDIGTQMTKCIAFTIYTNEVFGCATLYFYQLQTGDFISTKKMILLK
jgi:hypothetical protein